ncbi:MAG: glycosyltransferase, partial [Nitrospinae bacterium]|nr:glycosyltransferase [Nitrospinota bacterium]
MDAPAISVIIPAYNEEALLPGTLGHLFAQPGSFEVLVIDGASTDKTAEVARSFLPVRLLESPKGRAVQMNR